jgi:hypothetical protein
LLFFRGPATGTLENEDEGLSHRQKGEQNLGFCNLLLFNVFNTFSSVPVFATGKLSFTTIFLSDGGRMKFLQNRPIY